MAKSAPVCVDTTSDKAQQKLWQAQSDLRTLRDAIEIRKDAVRFKAAKAEAVEQRQALDELAKDK